MNVMLDPTSQEFVDNLVSQGRYRTAAEAVTDGLHLLAEREAKFQELKQSLIEAMESDEWLTDEEVDKALDETAEELRRHGYAE